VKIYKTRWMVRFLRRERFSDGRLRDAISQAERGLVDADLGGGLVKLRVARTGKGKSGGYRMLVAYRRANRAVFLYGFAKNERENIESDELLTLREIGAVWLAASLKDITQAVKDKALEEVADDEDEPT